MEFNGSNYDTLNELWNWQDQEYCFQSDSCTVNSYSLWDEMTQNEDSPVYMLQEYTPVKDCVDFGNSFHSGGDSTQKEAEENKDSYQFKRRRVLQFSSESSDSITRNDKSSSCYLNTEVRVEARLSNELPEYLHLTPEWDVGASDDKSTFSSEGLEQSSEGRLGNCFNESEMPCALDELNVVLASNEQIDLSEFYHALEETDMQTDMGHTANVAPAPAPQRFHKGRKPLVKTPMKLTTSIAYPFALIKPCGDVTLRDINQRIRAPILSRSINKIHEDLSASYSTSAFSGKPVIVKTKIRTEGGKGSITITRTKG